MRPGFSKETFLCSKSALPVLPTVPVPYHAVIGIFSVWHQWMGSFSQVLLASSKAFLTDAGQFWALTRQAWPHPSPPVVPRPASGSVSVCWDGCSVPGRRLTLASPISGWICFSSFLSPNTALALAFHKAAPHQTQRVPLGAPTTPAHLCILFSQLKQPEFAVPRSVLGWGVQLMDLVLQPTCTFLAPKQLVPVPSSLTCHRDVPSMIQSALKNRSKESTWNAEIWEHLG